MISFFSCIRYIFILVRWHWLGLGTTWLKAQKSVSCEEWIPMDCCLKFMGKGGKGLVINTKKIESLDSTG